MNEKIVPGSISSWPTPGPGNYENPNELHYKKISGSKIGKDGRSSFFLKTSVTGTPDAGNYEKPGFATINANPKFSIGKSLRDLPSEGRPSSVGPGSYNYINQVGNANDYHLANLSKGQ